MRPALVLLVFLAFTGVLSAAEVCVECSAFANASAANILYEVDQTNKTLTVNLFYENFSSSPSRLPINNTIVIVELTNSSGLKEIYKVYTNNEGKAIYNFAALSDGCLSLKVLYCPFCNPGDPACGFAECLRYAKIHNETFYYDNVPVAITSANDIPDGTSPIGAPGTLNSERYFPDLRVAGYCAPPPPLNATPALCLPLLIIFSLLGGALYLTGRNPFIGFNLGGARVGRHIRYQARGRGFSMSVMSVVSAAQSIAGAAKALAKGGGKELAKQEAAAAKGRVFLVGDAMKAKAGISAASSAASAAGKRGAKSGTFSRHMEARMGSGTGGGGPTQQQQSGTSMAMTPGSGGGIRASELVVKGNFAAQLFGSLGKMLVFAAMNTTLGRCVDGLISLGQGWTENGRERGIYEMLFVSHSARAQEDLGAMRDMMVTDSQGRMSGLRVTLPGGAEGVVRDITTNRDGSTTIQLEPSGGSGIRGDLTVHVAANGTITSMQFTVPVAMEVARRDANNQVITDAQGRPVTDPTIVNVPVTARQGPDGNLQFSVSVARGSPPELLAAVGQPNLSFGERPPAGTPDRPIDVRVTDANTIFTVARTGGGQDITMRDALYAASSGSAMHVGGNASDLVSQCQSGMTALREMQGSFQREIGEEMRMNRDRVEGLMTDDTRRYIGGVREREATRELALTLGISEDQLTSGNLLAGVSGGNREMGGRQGAALVGVSDAYRSSELGHDLVPGLMDSASDGVRFSGAGERDAPLVQTAVSRVVSTSSADELRRLDEGGLRTAVTGELTTQLMRENPNMSRADAERQAGQMVQPMNFQAMEQRLDRAVVSFDRALQDRGFNQDMRTELQRVDTSQVGALAQFGAPTYEGGRFQSPSAMLQAEGRVQTAGGGQVDTYQISPELRSALNEHAHLEAMYNASSQVAGNLQAGRFSTQDIGQLQFMQQANLRFADSVIATGAQQQGTPQQYGVAEDLNRGTTSLAQADIYGSHLPHADQGTIHQREEEERRAREEVQTAVLRGDLVTAQALVNERVQTYAQSGNQTASQGWMDVSTTIQTWRDNPQAYQAARGDASGMALSTLVPEMHPAGADYGAIAQRETQVGLIAQQEYSARAQIADAFRTDDYRTAEAACAQQVRYYRQMGDERTALAYEVALTQISGLRRDKDDPTGAGHYFEPSNFQGLEGPARQEAIDRARQGAETRILQDIGHTQYEGVSGPPSGLVGTAERVGETQYGRIGGMRRDGDARLSVAADRVNEQVRGGGSGSEMTGLTYGREPPPAE